MTIVNPKLRIAYWPTLKCGSTSMSDYFGQCDGFMAGKHTEDETEGYTEFGIVRDPVSRWISAVNTVRRVRLDRKVRSWENFLAHALEVNRSGELFTDGGNPHFAPQVDALPQRVLSLFPIRSIPLIPEWLKSLGVEGPDTVAHRRDLGDGHRQHAASQMTPEDRQFIRENYAQDENLYHEVMQGALV